MLVRTLPKDKTGSCGLSFFKTQFLECIFVLLPGVAERSEFTSDYSVLLAAVIHLNVETMIFAMCLSLRLSTA